MMETVCTVILCWVKSTSLWLVYPMTEAVKAGRGGVIAGVVELW